MRPGGIAIIATFADDGPEMRSGLPVLRYAPKALAQELDRLLPGRFEALDARRHIRSDRRGSSHRARQRAAECVPAVSESYIE